MNKNPIGIFMLLFNTSYICFLPTETLFCLHAALLEKKADNLFRSSNLNLSLSVLLTQQMPHILYSSALGLSLTAQRPEKPSNVSSGFTQLSAS